jgi:hypothetical protein
MGPQDPKDVTRDTARDLSGLAGEVAALKADAHHWLTGPEYAVLPHRLEDAHAAVEAALVEARRRVRMNEERPRAIGTGYYVVLCRILQVNFREFLFHALE